MEHMVIEKLLNIFHGHETHLYKEIAKLAASFTASEYGTSLSTVILSIILGCVCLYMFVKLRRDSKQKRVLKRSKSLSELYGGELAWRRLIDYKVALAKPDTLDRSDVALKDLLKEEHLNLKKLQRTVAKMEMVGKEDEAVKILREARRRYADKPHQVYEIDMLLVEMLIYTGDFEEALQCECLQHNEIEFDARRPLFKAVICGMLEDWEAAQYHWKEFGNMREFIKARYGLQKITDFESFKNRVEDLRSEILNKSKI